MTYLSVYPLTLGDMYVSLPLKGLSNVGATKICFCFVFDLHCIVAVKK